MLEHVKRQQYSRDLQYFLGFVCTFAVPLRIRAATQQHSATGDTVIESCAQSHLAVPFAVLSRQVPAEPQRQPQVAERGHGHHRQQILPQSGQGAGVRSSRRCVHALLCTQGRESVCVYGRVCACVRVCVCVRKRKRKSVYTLSPCCFPALRSLSSVLETELSKELYNGHLFRIMTKLMMVCVCVCVCLSLSLDLCPFAISHSSSSLFLLRSIRALWCCRSRGARQKTRVSVRCARRNTHEGGGGTLSHARA